MRFLQEVYPRLLDHGRGGEPDRHALRRSREPWREHFRGVTTVVTKLLNMCQPDVAYFGAKDFQQARVVEHLVRDLDFPVRIAVCPIVRDRDGLALSSRNAYLSDIERRRALSLKRALDTAEHAIRAGAASVDEVAAAARNELEGAGVEAEYVELVSAAISARSRRSERKTCWLRSQPGSGTQDSSTMSSWNHPLP